MTSPVSENSGKIAWVLALGGFLPFAALAYFVVFKQAFPFETSVAPSVAFYFWSAIILAFLGGIRWGWAVDSIPVSGTGLVLSTLPSIIAVFTIFVPLRDGIAILAVLYVLHGAWDYRYIRTSVRPNWFATVRVTLTALVTLAHGAVWLALGS